MKQVLIKRLFFLLGWLVLAVALASLVWSVLLWRYPVPVAEDNASTPLTTKKAAWLKGIEKHWVKESLSLVETQDDEPQEPIQVSRLAVKVQGVLFSNLAERSVVMLSYRNKDLTLSAGDELEEGILLIKIKQDALVFNRNGQLEQVLLNLDKTAKLNQQPEQKLSQPASAATNDLPSQVTEQRVGSRALEETFGPEFRQSLVRDPLQLMSYISVSPSSKEGQLQGFVLQPGSKPELFKHFGLQAGDLLVAVDGDLVTDTSAMMALYSRLATAEGLDIDLMRGDERLRIRIEME